MPKTFRRNVILGFGSSLALVILSSVASYMSIRELISNARLVDHTNKVIGSLENVSSRLLQSESSQRAFLLTKNTDFLGPFETNKMLVQERIAEVGRLTVDNNAQQSNIQQLIKFVNTRFEILLKGIQLTRQGRQVPNNLLMGGKEAMDNAQHVIAEMESIENNLLATRTKNLRLSSGVTPLLIIFVALVSVIITVLLYFRIVRDFQKRAALQEKLMHKDHEISGRLSIIQRVANKISSGNYSIRIGDEGKDLLGSLAVDLNKMAESLEYSFKMLSNKDWVQAGVAGVNEQMLGEFNVDTVCRKVLEFVAGYTDSKVGAIYLFDNKDGLVLVAGFALSGKASKMIRMGEGIVGQCAVDRKVINLNDVPDESVQITFASGAIKPKELIAIPLMHDLQLKGVMELGSLTPFNDNHKNFLEALSSQIGVAITGAQNRETLQELLEETQSQAEELQMQHNEMENINEELRSQSQKLQVSQEELKVQQEELMQTNMELEERTTLLEEKNRMIEERNQEIQQKAAELERTTRYKSEFLANMSHELRTPLNSILLLSRLMMENNAKNPGAEQVEFAHVIQTSGQGLLSLIDEILDLSKIESGKMEIELQQVAVKEVTNDLKAVFAPMVKEKNIGFDINVTGFVPEFIETDKMRLGQILKNLLSNAIKFTSTGTVSLTVDKDKNDTTLVFTVKDTGIGIAADKHEIIFEAFQQADGSTRRQYGGTGLGLSISRELARLLGGHITLKSEEGSGSEFRLYIPVGSHQNNGNGAADYRSNGNTANAGKPVSHNGPMPPRIEDDRAGIKRGDKIILIIEDDVPFAKTLLDISRTHGFKAVIATDGDQGIQLANQLRPAGILLDIRLPVKDGWEVMKDLKESSRTKQIPVHTMSSVELTQKSRDSGAIDFISKPLAYEKMGEVFRKIDEVIKEAPGKVLIVEENTYHARALAYFLGQYDIIAEVRTSMQDTIDTLLETATRCVILDMGPQYDKFYDHLEDVKKNAGLQNLPIILFTSKTLSRQEEKRIRQYADSIVHKTAHSYQRILDEVSLFLHLMQAGNNADDKPYRQLGRLAEVLKDKKVLVADDDVRNIFSLTKALEAVGMSVISALDGKEALQQVEEDPSIHVILMDMMMPEMDGYETMRKIRDNPRIAHVPIIAVTAKAMSGDREKCIQAGASDYITKPIDKDQLLSLLRVWLYEKV